LQRHDAELQIESVLHQGSTFRAVFPADRMTVVSHDARQTG
jgi:hypothetical protein